MLHLILSFVRALLTARSCFFFLSQSSTSCSSLAFSFGFRLRLHRRLRLRLRLVSAGFVLLQGTSRSPCLVSSHVHSRLQSHGCCLCLCHRVALRHPLFHTIIFILFVHVSVVGVIMMFLVRCTCASWHKKLGGRVPAVLVCVLDRDTPKCRAAWPPLFEVARPRLTKCGPGPGGPWQYPRSTTVLRSTSCLGARWCRHLLKSIRLHTTPYSYWRILNTACSL